MMFAAPPDQQLEWSDSASRAPRASCAGCGTTATPSPPPPAPRCPPSASSPPTRCPRAADVRREIHTHLKQASYDFGKHQFNTVVSAAMKILNALEKAHKDLAGQPSRRARRGRREGFSILLRLLSPITPHICHALWQDCGFGTDILAAQWPRSARTR